MGNDFKEISVAIQARDSPVTFEELYDKLQDQETLLKQDEAKKGNPPIIAHFHERYFLNNKGSNGSNGNYTVHLRGHSNNKESTSHFSDLGFVIIKKRKTMKPRFG